MLIYYIKNCFQEKFKFNFLKNNSIRSVYCFSCSKNVAFLQRIKYLNISSSQCNCEKRFIFVKKCRNLSKSFYDILVKVIRPL